MVFWKDEIDNATKYSVTDEEREEAIDEYIYDQLWKVHNGYYSDNTEFTWKVIED